MNGAANLGDAPGSRTQHMLTKAPDTSTIATAFATSTFLLTEPVAKYQALMTTKMMRGLVNTKYRKIERGWLKMMLAAPEVSKRTAIGSTMTRVFGPKAVFRNVREAAPAKTANGTINQGRRNPIRRSWYTLRNHSKGERSLCNDSLPKVPVLPSFRHTTK
jgi:hypothetical protein